MTQKKTKYLKKVYVVLDKDGGALLYSNIDEVIEYHNCGDSVAVYNLAYVGTLDIDVLPNQKK